MSNKKTREYYLGLFGVLGEIVSMKAYLHAPTAPATAGDELRLMQKEKIIRYHRHQDRVRTFRISDPAGFDAIEEYDKRLLDHAEMIAGRKGARYPGSKDYRIKKRREAVLMLNLLKAGFIVDGAMIKGSQIKVISHDMTGAEDIIQSCPKGAPLFLSGLLLKHRGSDVTMNRREMSISTGAIFSEGGIYNTYSISTAKFRWYGTAELTASSEIRRLYETAKNEASQSDGRLRAILYADSDSVAGQLLALAGDNEQRMNPVKVFKLCYVASMEDVQNAMDITRMLTIPNWRLKANKALGLSPATDKYDGETEDGRRIHNLLCCNLAKLKNIGHEIRKGRCKLVVHDWQKPLIEELYETEIDAMVLSSKHFKGLLVAVERMQEEEIMKTEE